MVSIWGLTDKGIVRKENQDSYAYDTTEAGSTWGVVCDGMGGARAGDIAITMAVEHFRDHLLAAGKPRFFQKEGDVLVQAVEEANQAVFELAQEEPEYAGMGTTLVGLLLRGKNLWVVNVGDSRCYHLSSEGIRRITRDHSIVEEMVQRGDLTEEEARHHPQKNLITRALGTARMVETDLFRESVEEGEAILLCSDGLVNEVTDQEIFEEYQKGGTPQEICTRLLDRTLRCGAPDNVTIVLAEV